MLQVINVSKSYATQAPVLAGVSFELGVGLHGLLGPNGAGKSTLMRTLVGLQAPDSGSVKFQGNDPIAQASAFRKQLGYLPQEFGVYPRASAQALLEYFACLKGIEGKRQRSRIAQVLHQVNLYADRRANVAEFSGGMRRRFGLAVTLLDEPQLVVVDEPSAGLDPMEAVELLGTLAQTAERACVLLSTHLVQDVQDLCSRVLVLHRSRIRFDGSVAEALKSLPGGVSEIEVATTELEGLRSQAQVLSTRRLAQGVSKVRLLVNAAHPHIVSPRLEDAYFLMTQK